VCALIAGVTVTAFDVPKAAPPPRSSSPEVTFTPAVIPDKASQPAPTQDPRKEQINEVLARAVRTIGEASAIGPLGAPAPQPDTRVFGVVSRLGEAMRLARDAKDDKDLAKAEEVMRSVRQEMDSVCDKAGGSGPLCQSAQQIRSLGY